MMQQNNAQQSMAELGQIVGMKDNSDEESNEAVDQDWPYRFLW